MSRYSLLPPSSADESVAIPLSVDGKPFGNGQLVRFTKSDGTSWIARFKGGLTDYNAEFEFTASSRVVIFSAGAGYLIDPDQEQLVATFG